MTWRVRPRVKAKKQYGTLFFACGVDIKTSNNVWQEHFSGIRKLSSLLVKDTMSELLLSTKRYQEANRRPRVCLAIHTKDKSYRNFSVE